MKTKKNLSLYLSVTVAVSIGLSCIPTTVYAAEPTYTVQATTTTNITPRAEKTEWKYRVVNGKRQKRLWSITNGKWLGDWIAI